MNPFTLFFARLVELLGAETAAQLVREFAGQTIQLPVTDHYGFPVNAPVLGEPDALASADRIYGTSQPAPLPQSALATQPRGARLLALAHELSRSSQALQRYAVLLEQGRSTVLAEIECQQREMSES